MPVAAPRPCKHAGCGQLVRDGSGYCAKHQDDAKVGKFSDPHRGSRHERGYDYEWEKRRKRILSRDKGLCQPCKKAGRYRPARAVDHIMSKAEAKRLGWSESMIEDDSNLQSICDDCHDVKTAAEAKRARGGGG